MQNFFVASSIAINSHLSVGNGQSLPFLTPWPIMAETLHVEITLHSKISSEANGSLEAKFFAHDKNGWNLFVDNYSLLQQIKLQSEISIEFKIFVQWNCIWIHYLHGTAVFSSVVTRQWHRAHWFIFVHMRTIPILTNRPIMQWGSSYNG